MRVLPWLMIGLVLVAAGIVFHSIDKEYSERSSQSMHVAIEACVAAQLAASAPIPVTAAQVSGIRQNCMQEEKDVTSSLEEVAKPRLEEMKWLLTVIGAIGAFFAIAQAGAAWFAAEAYVKKADDALRSIGQMFDSTEISATNKLTSIDLDAKGRLSSMELNAKTTLDTITDKQAQFDRKATESLAEIQKTQDKIRARYPLFEKVEEKRDDAFRQLDNVFRAASKAQDKNAGSTEALDWKDNLYRKLDVPVRQELLSLESFASIDLNPGPFTTAEKYADILRKFALFYRSKFLYEDSVGKGTYSDLERAESYLTQALKSSPDFTIKNDLGSHYLSYYAVIKKKNTKECVDLAGKMLDKAKDTFEASLLMEPNQQRAHYNLAVIAGKYREQYEAAIQKLEVSLKLANWQRESSVYMTAIMHYNIACYKSRLVQSQALKGVLGTPVTQADCRVVLERIEHAVQNGSVRKELIREDFEDTEGDFTGLLKIADGGLQTALQVGKDALIKASR